MAKVCLLAAGKGTRLGSRTAYFPKTMLRVGDKAIISHIIDYYPKNYEFVIVLGYLGNILKQYIEIAHPDIKVVFVEQEVLNGPGGALLLCEQHLQEPFYIHCSDTLVDKFTIDEEKDWIGTSLNTIANEAYSCMSFWQGLSGQYVETFYEKNKGCKTNAPYIGCAFIKHWKDFWYGMNYRKVKIQEEIQVSSGFVEMLGNDYNVQIKDFEWYDTGDNDKLQKTREYFKSRIENLDKQDEEIYFLNDKVIKYFYNEKNVENRIKRNKSMNSTTPAILEFSKNFYSYEFVEGIDLFNFKDRDIYTEYLLEYTHEKLWKPIFLSPEELNKFYSVCDKFYKQKTEARLMDFYFKTGIKDQEEKINGVLVPKLSDILNKIDWEYLNHGTPTIIHGDFNFSNIILTKDLAFKFIDIRQDFGGLLEYGDFYYDAAKFLSGLLLPHDEIKKGNIWWDDKENKLNIYRSECYNGCEDIFWHFVKQKGYDEKKIRILANIVFLNMSSLHEDPLDKLLYYSGKYGLSKYV